ncbi:MAG: hypothetical protein M3Q12_04615 [Pseudomonadota bacterium]|uniref:hypothetical protein n=1 Tax=Polaromonas sp. TaxID=1869339 RepID=UPI0017F57E6D|nr:hypothetical protein [Polaromonas sp.]MBA3594069.1 hypothetical protein [Polaromonas sp.]MDQ3271439.1 hypothetical protein [Pseudomonadota bacterium]
MLRKLIVLAVTSGLAAKWYRNHASKRAEAAAAANAPVATRRRRAGTPVNQG